MLKREKKLIIMKIKQKKRVLKITFSLFIKNFFSGKVQEGLYSQ